MNWFDLHIIHFFNTFAHRSWTFDATVYFLSENDLVKGGITAALIWWAWFRPQSNNTESRRHLLWGLIACLLAIVVARSFALELPYRERPLHNPAVHFQAPYEVSDDNLIHWSSFPSDHAAVFFALATSLFLAWRLIGLLAFLHVTVVIALPRIYLGFHYPTDILGGALIGIVLASISRMVVVRGAVAAVANPWLQYSPGSFYACFFILTSQIATIFDSMRHMAVFLYKLWRH